MKGLQSVVFKQMFFSSQFKVFVDSRQLCHCCGAESVIQLTNGITLHVFHCTSCVMFNRLS